MSTWMVFLNCGRSGVARADWFIISDLRVPIFAIAREFVGHHIRWFSSKIKEQEKILYKLVLVFTM